MGVRQKWISASIIRAILYDIEEKTQTLLHRILSFFHLFRLVLVRFEAFLFKQLREQIWSLDVDEYADSFLDAREGDGLTAMGDLGYSGSTFFHTPNSKYLVKSLLRPSEYSFFEQELVKPYGDHMAANPESLLIRITDFLHTPFPTLGGIFRLTPSRQMVMENLLYGRESSSKPGDWEVYDLKPTSYFFPERDIAGGHLASEATKSRLADDFPDKLRITKEQFSNLHSLLEVDTMFLEKANVVDYSLFLVRFPALLENPNMRSGSNEWRRGVRSTDGKWTYRAALLDFFWAAHKSDAQAMTMLVQIYNLIGRHGPMSITTTAKEYRERFLRMVVQMVEVHEEQ